MNQNEFLKQLEDKLKENQVENIDEIMDIYTKRFELGHEAEMSDDEIIEMLGPISSIVRKYVPDDIDIVNENNTNYILRVSTIYFETLDIIESEENGLHFYYDKKDESELLKCIDIKEDKESLIITSKLLKFRFKRGFKVTITVGPDVFFKDFEVKNTSTKLNVCPIFAKRFYIGTTSGDIKVDNINAVETEVSSVSGDIDLKNIKTATLRIKNVSGDMDFEDIDANKMFVSTISGDIYAKSVIASSANLSTISGDIKFDKSSIPTESLHTSRISGDIVLNTK